MLASGVQIDWLTGDEFTGLLFAFGLPLAAVGLVVALRVLASAGWTPIVAIAGTVGGLWVIDYFLIASDYRDAGGFIDCGLNCSRLQDLVAVAFWYGGLLLVLLILVSLGAFAALAMRRSRARKWR